MKRREKSAIQLYEEAVYLLRRAPGSAILAYYAGALPFVLGFLFFWADMSQGAFAYEHCAAASLGLALLFCWMVYGQTIFVQSLRCELSGAPPTQWFSLQARRLGVMQFAVQPTKFLVLPASALIVLPYASIYAFYHHLMSAPDDGGSGWSAVRAARTQSIIWQWQSWTVLLIYALLSVFVFVNIGVTILAAPYLLRSVLGIETVFTKSGLMAFNTTFLAVTVALTYLVTNPLAKTVYLLRSFYAESIETGEDLKSELKSGLTVTAASLIALMLIAGSAPMSAQTSKPKAASTVASGQIDPSEMQRAIDDVIHRPEFTWRLPRPERPPGNSANWFVRVTESFLDATARGLRQLARWIAEFIRWLGEKLRNIIPAGGPNLPSPDSRELQALVYTLLAVVAALLGWLLLKALRLRKPKPISRAAALAAPPVDLNSLQLLADQKLLDEWLQLAHECRARQEYRLALRALYLAGLAYLADQSLISIHCGKSNLDYSRELRRKARGQPELLATFADNVRVFERTWYGMYDVDLSTLDRFETNVTGMKAGGDAR